MITFLRSMFSSKIGTALALAFVVLVALAFALGDVSGNSFGGLGGGTAAKVGGETISTGVVNQSVDNAHRGARRENPQLDMASFVRGGGLDGTIEQLINSFAIAVFAQKNGIGVSPGMIDAEVRKIPGVTNPAGQFDPEILRNLLRQNGLSETQVREDYGRGLYAEQVLGAARLGATPASTLIAPYASLLLEKRAGEVAVIPSVAFAPKAPPSDAVLGAYYRANPTRFQLPERRVVTYALFDKSQVAAAANPTDAEIQKYYADHRSEYAPRVARDFTQVVASSEAAARTIAREVTAGKPLSAVAAAQGLAAAQVSAASEADYAAKNAAATAVAKAAYAAPVGGTIVARGPLGWFVVKVEKQTAVAARPLADMRESIAGLIRNTKTAELMSQLTGEMEDSFANGESLADVAKARRLTLQDTPALFATGQNPHDRAYKAPPELEKILPAAFQLTDDGEPQLVELQAGERFALVGLKQILPAAPPPLGEIKGTVATDWALAEGQKRAKIAAEQVRRAVLGGTPLAAALAKLGVPTPKPTPINGTRAEILQGQQRVPPPLALMFSMPRGSAKTLEAPANRGWFVVYLADVTRGNAASRPDLVAATTQQLGTLISDEYGAQFARAVQGEVGVKRNESAIADIRRRLSGGGQQP